MLVLMTTQLATQNIISPDFALQLDSANPRRWEAQETTQESRYTHDVSDGVRDGFVEDGCGCGTDVERAI